MPRARRLLGGILAATAVVFIAVDLGLHVVAARLTPTWRSQLASALPGVAVQWQGLRVTPWGQLIVTDLHVTPADPTAPRLTAARLIVGYRWEDLAARRWTRVRQLRLDRPRVVLGAAAPPGTTAPGRPAAGPSWPDVLKHVQQWSPDPIRVTIVDASIAAPGLPPLVTRGGVRAEWHDGQVAVHEARAQIFGITLWTHGTLTEVTTSDPQWQFQLFLAGPQLSGRLEIGEAVRHSRIVGEMAVANAATIPIAAQATVTRERLETSAIQAGPFQAVSGVLDWVQQRWSVTLAVPAGGTVTGQGSLTGWQHPQAEVVLRDVRLGPLTVSTTAQVAAAWTGGWDLRRPVSGTVMTRDSTVNHQPVGELSGRWAVTEDGVELSDWRVGDALRLSGMIGTKSPYPMALTVDLTAMDAAAVASVADPGKTPVASGVVGGRVELRGTAAAPRVHGVLTGFDGRIGRTAFLVAKVRFVGEGSVIHFYDSQIRQSDQVVRMEGAMDLAQMGTPTVFQHIRMMARPRSDGEGGR